MSPELMHATQVPRPFHTKGWVYEEKYDGWRMLAVKEAGGASARQLTRSRDTQAYHLHPYFDSDYRVEDLGARTGTDRSPQARPLV